MPYDINESWFLNTPDSRNVTLVHRRPIDLTHHLAKGDHTTRDEIRGYYPDVPSALAGYVKQAGMDALSGPAAELLAKLDAIHADVRRFAEAYRRDATPIVTEPPCEVSAPL